MKARVDSRRLSKAMHAALFSLLTLCVMFSAHADEPVDLGHFSTFDVRDGRITGELTALSNPRLTHIVKAQLEARLKEKGLTTDAAKPDLIVTFELVTARGKEARAVSTGRMSGGAHVVVKPRSEGTLTVDVLDAGTHARVWRGVASDDAHTPKDLAEHIDGMIEKAVKKFPKKKQ